MKVCGDFGVLVFFLLCQIIWLFMTFVELLGLVYAFFSVYEIIWLFGLVVGHDVNCPYGDEVKCPYDGDDVKCP
jgi:hypothetical protein